MITYDLINQNIPPTGLFEDDTMGNQKVKLNPPQITKVLNEGQGTCILPCHTDTK